MHVCGALQVLIVAMCVYAYRSMAGYGSSCMFLVRQVSYTTLRACDATRCHMRAIGERAAQQQGCSKDVASAGSEGRYGTPRYCMRILLQIFHIISRNLALTVIHQLLEWLAQRMCRNAGLTPSISRGSGLGSDYVLHIGAVA